MSAKKQSMSQRACTLFFSFVLIGGRLPNNSTVIKTGKEQAVAKTCAVLALTAYEQSQR